MSTNGITNIFFDLDHTLWDFERNSALTFKKIFALNDIDVDIDRFLEVYVPINFKYWKLYREERIDKPSLRFGRLNDAFGMIGYQVKPRMIHTLSKDYITYLSTFNHLFDGTHEILDYLKVNYRLHIITNGFKEVQQSKLNSSNIDHYFITVTNSEMVGAKKPNPKIFRHALQVARASTDNSIMIGDSYEADVLGALDMGLDAIFFNTNGHEVDGAIKQVNNLLELKRYL